MFSFLRDRKQQEDTPTVRLMKTIHFGGKDLEMNHAGELSDSQKKRFRRSVLQWLAFIGMYPLCYSFAFYFSIARTNGHLTANLFAVVVLLSTYIVLKAVLYWHNRKMSKAQVIAFTGQAAKHPPALIIAIDYEARTQHIYGANKAAYTAFIEGETYTFYSPSFEPTKILSALHVPAEG